MENNFERDVQKKLQELKIPPSEKVWENVAATLEREKKPRIFLWLSMAAMLLIATAIFFVYHKKETGPNPETVKSPIIHKEEKKNGDEGTSSQNHANQNTNTDITDHVNNSTLKPNPHSSIENSYSAKEKVASTKDNYPNRVAEQRNTNQRQRKFVEVFANNVSTNDANKISLNTENGQQFEILSLQKNAQEFSLLTQPKLDLKPREAPPLLTGKYNQHIKTVNKTSGLKWGFGANVGIGNVVQKNLFGNAKSDIYNGSNPGVPDSLASPASLSKVNSRGAFGFRSFLEKELGKHFTVGVSLGYQNFNTHIIVDKRPMQLQPLREAVSFVSGIPVLKPDNEDYINHYHFGTVGTYIAVQPGKHKKIRIDAGVEYARLLHTNALVQEENSTSFVDGKDIIKKGQAFANLGASYAFTLKSGAKILAGPQAQYGLGSLYTNNRDKKLASLGVGFRFILP